VARLRYIQNMSEVARSRIDPNLKRDAENVLREIGMSPRAALEAFYAQIIKLRALPFTPSQFPVLQEYRVTLAQADRAEAAALDELEADLATGKAYEFKGKLK
jgi:addiction module RelB/DinJ family antitoxin